jgi:hypothetical protein
MAPPAWPRLPRSWIRSAGWPSSPRDCSATSPPDAVGNLWQRIAGTLAGFPEGIYLSDLHLAEESSGPLAGAFRSVLSAFVRGRVHIHFQDTADARRALEAAGFTRVALHRPVDFADRIDATGPGAEIVRVIEAEP